MPKDVEECVSSVMDDNPEMDESRAYAICQAQKNEGNLEDFDTDDIDTHMSDPRIAVSRTFAAGAEQIERVEESDGSVRYKNITLLSPGEWTDSKSRTTFYYSPEGIKNSVDNWEDNKLHLNHDGQDTVLAEIGHVDTETVRATSEGRMVGDIVFHMRTPTSEEAEALMELAYDTNGEQGPGGPSVEIMDTKDEFDDSRGMMETTEMTFSGVGIVTHPAAQDISFDEQMAALQDNAQKAGVRLMSQSQTDKDTETESEGMDDEKDESPIQKLRDAREELDRELQGDEEMEMAMDALEAFLGDNDNSAEDSVSEMVAWVSQNLDEQLAQAASMLVDEFSQTVEEDLENVDVSELREFVASMNDGEDEMMEEDEEEEEEDDMEMGELKERVSELESKISKMRENQGEVVEELSALTETLQGVNKELQAVKDEPQPRALSESLEDDTEDDDGSQPLFAGEMTGTRSFSFR